MLVSKATKLLELGHSDFDQVYAMDADTARERPPGINRGVHAPLENEWAEEFNHPQALTT